MVPPVRLVYVLHEVGYRVADMSMGMPIYESGGTNDFVVFSADGLPDVSFIPSTEIELEDARTILLATGINIPKDLWDSLEDDE